LESSVENWWVDPIINNHFGLPPVDGIMYNSGFPKGVALQVIVSFALRENDFIASY